MSSQWRHHRISRPDRLAAACLSVVVIGCGGSDTTGPPQLTITSGNNQEARVGHALPTPLTVTVATSDGAPRTGETVTWTVISGNGSLSASSVATDGAGHASVNWTLGDVLGEQKVQATVENFTLEFSATATPLRFVPAILHYDGTGWTVALQSPNDAPVQLRSVWGASPSAVFAVGSQCGVEIILRFDGTAWDQPSQTCPGSGYGAYSSVWGNSASDVFATKGEATNGPSARSDVMHFDGQSWNSQYTRACSFCDPYLNAVWSGGPSEVVAVGDSGFIVHYDGSNWTPQTSGTTKVLNAVWGIGSGLAARIFAVGWDGTILFFDGTTWHAQTSNTTANLSGVWGTSATDVFAVGGSTILHYDGNSWTTQPSPSGAYSTGVWGSSGNSVFAIGGMTSYEPAGIASTSLYYNGSSWVQQQLSIYDIALRAVWGSSPTNVWAVGSPACTAGRCRL
jgi:hypothetical protein